MTLCHMTGVAPVRGIEQTTLVPSQQPTPELKPLRAVIS